jgi:CheY-like chemotaxis protein
VSEQDSSHARLKDCASAPRAGPILYWELRRFSRPFSIVCNLEQNSAACGCTSDEHACQHPALHASGPGSTDFVTGELLAATNGRDGLRLFMFQTVDAIVIDYHLGLLDGAVVAAEIKQVRLQVPIVMLADHAELPVEALNSVDAVVARSEGPYSLWAAVHFVLIRPAHHRDGNVKVRSRQQPRRGVARARRKVAHSPTTKALPARGLEEHF